MLDQRQDQEPSAQLESTPRDAVNAELEQLAFENDGLSSILGPALVAAVLTAKEQRPPRQASTRQAPHYDLNLILQRLNVEAIYGPLPFKNQGSTLRAPCPLHQGQDRNFVVFPNGGKGFHCHVCGKHGSAVTFIELFLNVSTREAIKILAQRAGIEPDTSPEPRPQTAPKPQEYEPIRDLSERDRKALGQVRDKGRAWLEKTFPGLAEHMLAAQDVADPALLLDVSDAAWRARQGYGVFFPMRSLEEPEKIAGGRFRFTSPGKAPETKKSLSREGAAGGRYGAVFGDIRTAIDAARHFGGLEQALRERFGAPVIVIAEGEKDHASAKHGVGFLSVIGIGGAGEASKPARFLLEQTDFKGFILLALHGDKAGREATKTVQEALKGQSRIRLLDARLPQHPEDADKKGDDLNDILIKGGGAAIRDRLLRAEPVASIPASSFKSAYSRLDRELMRRFAERHPNDPHQPGLNVYGRVLACSCGFDRHASVSKRTGMVRYGRIIAFQCGIVICIDCRRRLSAHNAGNLVQWRDVVRFSCIGDFEGLTKLRKKLTDKTRQARKEAGADAYGIRCFLNPQGLDVYATGPRAILEIIAKITGVKGEPVADIAAALQASLLRYGEYTLAQIRLNDHRIIEGDRWLTSRIHQYSGLGRLLPFHSKITREPIEAAEIPENDPDQVEVGWVAVRGQGIIAITEQRLSPQNRARLETAGRERLYRECNLARVLANKVELLSPVLRSILAAIVEDHGGLDPMLIDPEWWTTLSRYERDEVYERVIALDRALRSDPISRVA